jgi:hypothetical protein
VNYWVRLAKGPVSRSDIFWENTPQDWARLRALLEFGYIIESVESDPL